MANGMDGIIPFAVLDKKISDLGSDIAEDITEATENWLEENVDPSTGYVLDNTLTLDNAAPPASTVGDLKTAVNCLAFAGQTYEPITSWIDKTNNDVTNNEDGTFTLGTSDYGTIIFERLTLKPGVYFLFGVSIGFSFLSTTAVYTNAFATNETNQPKCIIIDEEIICYLGYRSSAKPSSSYTITPYLLLDRINDLNEKTAPAESAFLPLDFEIGVNRFASNGLISKASNAARASIEPIPVPGNGIISVFPDGYAVGIISRTNGVWSSTTASTTDTYTVDLSSAELFALHIESTAAIPQNAVPCKIFYNIPEIVENLEIYNETFPNVEIGVNRYISGTEMVVAENARRASVAPFKSMFDSFTIIPNQDYRISVNKSKDGYVWEEAATVYKKTKFTVANGYCYFFFQFINQSYPNDAIPQDAEPVRMFYGDVMDGICETKETASDISQLLYKDINNIFIWETGGLGSDGGDYDDRSTSIRTSVYLSIKKIKEVILDDSVTDGFLCLYKDSGANNGFLTRIAISADSDLSKQGIEIINANATRFRLEIKAVDGDISEYSLAQIISAEDVDSPDIYEEKRQEAAMMLLHKTGAESYGRCQFSAMIMSDIHNEQKRAKRIFGLMKSWGASYFDAFINCGDTVATTYSTDLSWYNNAVSAIGVPHINVLGNHDAWSSLSVLGSQATAYNKIIAPLADQTGIVQPSGASENSLCYYYFDLGTGVRVIALDCMFWDSDEATWLETVLDDAKTNSKSVICVSHYGFGSANMTQIKSLWREFDVTTTDAINIAAAQKVKAFIDAGGEFICWLVGHTHGDNLHKLSDYGNQLVLTFATPVQRAAYIQKSDTQTDYNYTLATFLTVDKYYKTVRLLRIGADIDTWGIKHNGVSLNYETGELIGSWS